MAQLPTKLAYGVYPNGVDKIPYASWMKINRYSYQEGIAQVAKNQKDALRILSEGNIISAAANTIGSLVHNVYNTSASQLANDLQFGDPSLQGNSNIGVQGLEEYLEDIKDGKIDNKDVQEKIDKARKRRQDQKAAASATTTYVGLSLPNEFQYEYGANWNNTFKLGTLALIADNPANAGAAALAGASIMGGAAALLNKAKVGSAASGVAQAAGQGAAFGIDPFNVASQLNPTNLIGLAGLAPNENAIQFFKNMDFRSFTLNFELASRSYDESLVVDTLINWFKRAMHPKSFQGGGTGGVLGFPDVFTLEPQFNKVSNGEAKPIQHPMMPKTKLCALTNLKVNTTPFNTLTTVFDGTIPLVTMQLTFTELTALTEEDFKTGVGY
jgi:hypothetical protein